MVATLRQRNFALLWLAVLISNAGDWVLFIGLPMSYIFLLTHSVLPVSIMMLAGRIPNVLLGSVAGALMLAPLPRRAPTSPAVSPLPAAAETGAAPIP